MKAIRIATRYAMVTLVLATGLSGATLAQGQVASGTTRPMNELDKLRSEADANDPAAMYELGLRYSRGTGVAKDRDQAVMWLHRSAAAGHADAMFHLGALHQNVDKGVAHDMSKAALWFSKAAKQGHGEAMFALGTLYWSGRGVTQDVLEAYKWLELASVYGLTESSRKRAADARDSMSRAKTFPADGVTRALAAAREWQAAFARRDR